MAKGINVHSPLGQEGSLGRACFLAGDALTLVAAYKQQGRMVKHGGSGAGLLRVRSWLFGILGLCNLRQVLNISGPWFPLGVIESFLGRDVSRIKWADVPKA